jgi:hypothetical protein
MDGTEVVFDNSNGGGTLNLVVDGGGFRTGTLGGALGLLSSRGIFGGREGGAFPEGTKGGGTGRLVAGAGIGAAGSGGGDGARRVVAVDAADALRVGGAGGGPRLA